MSVIDNLRRRKKNEQCLLLHYLLKGAHQVGSGDEATHVGFAHFNQNCKYTSFIPINGSPTEMMSVLTGRSDLASLLHLTPYQLSFLVPKIRLYKTFIGQPGTAQEDKTWDVELLFADNFTGIIENTALSEHSNPLERMLSDRAGRGTGVGIKGFSWKYEGTNPAEAANLLSANLSIHFNDIRELFEKRGPFAATLNPPEPVRENSSELRQKEDCYYQFADLIMRTAATGEAAIPQGMADEDADAFCKWMWLYDPEYFELKAVVGWEFKDGAPFSPAQRQNLKSASIILYLTIYDHVISYNEDGTMSLDISYKAAIESVLEDRNTDLFLTVFERARQAQIQAMINALETGQEQLVTADGNIRATPQDANVGASSPPRAQAAGLEGTAGLGDTGSDEQLVDILEDHLKEMRALTRGMGYATLQKWLWDETFIPTLEDLHMPGADPDITAKLGRKLAIDPVDYSESRPVGTGVLGTKLTAMSDSSYGGRADPEAMYGAPWPLSYAEPHGAKTSGQAPGDHTAGFAAFGLARIKTAMVNPLAVGRETDSADPGYQESEEHTEADRITFVAPPWSYTGGYGNIVGGEDSRDGGNLGLATDSPTLAGTGLGSGTTGIDDPEARDIGSQMEMGIRDVATPGETMDSPGDTASITARLLESAVNRRVMHSVDLGSADESWRADLANELGDNTYPLRFIYYGDLLDWAIRKALWRPPYTPDQFYVSLDTFSQLSQQTAGFGARDGLYRDFRDIEALSQFNDAPLTPGEGSNHVSGATLADTGEPFPLGGSLIGPSTPESMADPEAQREQGITIDSAIKKLDNLKERKFDKLNIIVGSVEYFDPVDKTTRAVNLADIPISLARWNEFFLNKIQRPGVYSYNLKQFINDTLNDLVLDILGGSGCYQDPVQTNFSNQTFDIAITNFTLPALYNPETEQYEDPAAFLTSPDMYINATGTGEPVYRIDINKVVAALAGDPGDPDNPKRSLFETNEDNTEVFHFIAIYARGYESSTLLGLETDEEAEAAVGPGGWITETIEARGGTNFYENIDGGLPGDLNRGIFHFYLGQNQGMIKSIKFTRTDQEYLAESRLMGHGAFGYNQLRGRYEATIVMQGNTFFLPGQYIYINPDSVGSGDSTTDYNDAALLLGLGGYYVVLDIESVITPEFYETILKCVWHSSGRLDICNAAGAVEENLLATGVQITAEDAAAYAASVGESMGQYSPAAATAPVSVDPE